MVTPSWESLRRPEKRQEVKNVEEDIKVQSEEKSPSPQWGDFKTPMTYQGKSDPLADEGTLGYIIRNAIANASRVGEQIAGRFGNIEQFAKDTLVNLPTTGGILGWAVSELVGPEKWRKLIKGDSDHQVFPTSEQFKEISEGISGGYTKPKTGGEKRFQEFTEDVGSIATGRFNRIPGATNAQAARQWTYNHILIPAAANVTKQIVDQTGFGENKANLAKLAVWLPLSLANNVNAKRYASDLMNEGRNGIPANLQFDVNRLQQRLQTVSQSPALLRADPRSALARQELASIQRDLRNGQTSVRDLMTTYDGINAAKRSRGMFDLSRPDRTFARNSIDRVRDAVRDEIMEAAASHPEALNNWRSGLQSWAVIHESNAVSNWISGIAKGPYAKILTGPAAALFGVGTYAAKSAPFLTGSSAAVAGGAHKTGQTIYRMWNSEPLRNYYWNAIQAAQQQNIPAFIKNYNKLNNELENSKSRKPKRNTKK